MAFKLYQPFSYSLADLINAKHPGLKIQPNDFTISYSSVYGVNDYTRTYSIEENTDTSIDRNTMVRIKASTQSQRFYGFADLYYNRINLSDLINENNKKFYIVNPNWNANEGYLLHQAINTWFLDHFDVNVEYNSFVQDNYITANQEQTITLHAKPDAPYLIGSASIDLKLIDITNMVDLQTAITDQIMNGFINANT